jgi:hypothetical protein
MRLFSDFVRTDTRELRSPETHYAFYNRAAGSFWDDVREVLESWFAHLPVASQKNIASRLRDKDRRKFDGAFWELYLHELFLRLGYAVQHEPNLPREGTSALTPDFLLEHGAERLYVEALVVTDSDSDDSEERRRNDLVDAINRRVSSKGLLISFDIRRAGPANPPIAKIAQSLEAWLDALDPDLISAIQHELRVFDWPSWEWNRDGWQLDVVAMPRPPEDRERPSKRVIALGPSGGKISDEYADARIIRDRLVTKAKKYQDLDVPYMIALLVRRSFCDEADVRGALFGPAGADPELLREGWLEARLGGDRDGFWATRNGPQQRHVSAMLCARNLQPAMLTEVAPVLWYCPWAAHPLTVSLPFAAVREVPSASVYIDPATLTPAEIFKLPSAWPRGAPFPQH